MAGDKSTGSIHNAYKDNGTSTSNFYSSVNISAIKTALDGVLPAKYKITSLQIKITASFTCNSNARVYIQAGLSSSTNSIGTTILEEKQIADMAKSGTETYTRDIASYLASNTSSNITTSYGSYLVFRMQSDNWFKKTFTINSVTLTVKYNDCFTITLNANGGTCPVSSITRYENDTYGTVTSGANNPTKAGYTFSYWATNADGTGRIYSSTVVTGNTTLYAQYTVNSYTISKEVSPSDSGDVTGAGIYEYGKSATLEAVPNADYRFVKWNDDVTTNPRTVTVTGNATYTAYFELDKINQLYNGNTLIKGMYTDGKTIVFVVDGTVTPATSIFDTVDGYHIKVQNTVPSGMVEAQGYIGTTKVYG